MLGAIYIGLSGMDAYEKGLQTISNNVANLNSDGYKAATIGFDDMFDHGEGGLGMASDQDGGATGDGVRFGTPFIDYAQGELRPTDNGLDLAIKGGGFLVLLGGDRTNYARTGTFAIDTDGFISAQGSDRHLAVLDPAGRAVALNVGDKRTDPPQATTGIVFAENLSSSATDATVPDLAVYDSRGTKQLWTIKFTRDQAAGASESWAVAVTDANGRSVGTSTLKFIGGTVDPATAKLVIDDTPAGADPLAVTLDFSSVTSYSAGTSSTLRASSVDGHGAGELSDVAVDDAGRIKLTYSNGQTTLEGEVAIADFQDPQRLQRLGDGLYQDEGGEPVRLRASGADGVGVLKSKQLEASNVDLSKEFGDLILVQRGYQASSQVVSIANDMIQTLFGIRGQ